MSKPTPEERADTTVSRWAKQNRIVLAGTYPGVFGDLRDRIAAEIRAAEQAARRAALLEAADYCEKGHCDYGVVSYLRAGARDD